MKLYRKYIVSIEGYNVVLNPFDYLDFYSTNVHPYIDVPLDNKTERIYEGITGDEFWNKHSKNYDEVVQKIITNNDLCQFQTELGQEGKEVCMINLYILSMFLIEKAKSKYVVLLSPTIQETLSKINDVSKITFTNLDGTKSDTSSKILIQEIMELLQKKSEKSENTYEVEMVVTWDKVVNHSLILSYFVHDLTEFLNKYFPVKRKKGAKISTKEVDLILFLMQYCGLSKVKVSNKRYWQLMSIYEHINKQSEDLMRFPIDVTHMLIPTLFLPYSIWSNNNVDWTNDDLPKLKIEKGMTIQF